MDKTEVRLTELAAKARVEEQEKTHRMEQLGPPCYLFTFRLSHLVMYALKRNFNARRNR
jgi:hypothetical protein